jgi:hypothetical protein
MPKAHAEWTVLRHHPIEKLEENLWYVTGTLPGMSLKRVMTLVRLEDGSIVIHSAIALDEASMSEVEIWGKPAILLVPNSFHRLDAPAYVSRYPDLKVYCPRGGRKKIEEIVAVDGTYEDLGDLSSLSWEYLEGIGKGEAVFLVRSQSGTTLVFNDAVFNMPHGTGVHGFIFRYLTQSTGGPRVSRLFRLFALKDRAAFRAHLERLADTPDLLRVIVSHHQMIAHQPAEVLRTVADSL